MPTALTLDSAHHSCIRDLDAIISRLQDLTTHDWSRATPCAGWNIRDMAEHLAGTSLSLGQSLWTGVQVRTGAAFANDIGAEPTGPETSGELIARLIHGRNQLNHTLSQLTPRDLELVIRPAEGAGHALTIAGLLNFACSECGIHRFDLETAMGERYAGLPIDVASSADAVLGQWLVGTASKSEAHPDVPCSVHLIGDTLDHVLTWDDSEWRDKIIPEIPVTEIHADDSGIALFVTGRITVDDVRLRIKGDRAVAAQFKTWVPGP